MASLDGAGLTVGRVPTLFAFFNLVIVIGLGLTILFTYFFGEPYQRGFFCDDETIRYSVKDDTVPPSVLIAVSVCIPFLVVSISEALAASRDGPAGAARRVVLGKAVVPAWSARALWGLLVFAFGLGAQQVLVDAGKYSVGRLRPHFLAACAPSPPLHTLCPANATRAYVTTYVTDFVCTSLPEISREARLSFPSGHSSMSFYAAVFAALYAGRRFRWRRYARLQLAFGQLAVVMLAWLTALSRVADHKHHWSDVLAGSALGALVAALTVLFAIERAKKPPGRAGDVTYVFEETPTDAGVVASPAAGAAA